jgi:hypothetical protein
MQPKAALFTNCSNGSPQVLIGAHAPGDAIHDDANLSHSKGSDESLVCAARRTDCN